MSCIGKILGNRYEILEEIGTGGMATVYKAKDKVLNRFVAVKILKDEFSNDVEFIKRFQVEAQSAASLSHPNIVSIYDVGFEDSMHYIVMELIEGRTLKDIINEEGKLPWREAVGIASQIASGLSQAHRNHIIHRDIKPHNILITKDGVAKVTDFGIAKAVSSSTINAFDSTLGSVHYFSPEHARGGYTDEKSDIYSLGVVLYEMCTGTLPFDAKTPVAIALMHINEEPIEPISLCNTLPESVNTIILKAMEKETSERYSSASEMYNDLQKVLSDPSIKVAESEKKSSKDFPTQRIPIVNVPSMVNKPKTTENVNKYQKEQDEEETMGKKKKMSKPMALLRLFIVLGILIGLFICCMKLGEVISVKILGAPVESKTVTVPPLYGVKLEYVEETLKESGLELGEVTEVTDDTQPKGYVVKQDPKEGVTKKRGALVNIWVSLGSKTVTVPDVTVESSTSMAKYLVEMEGLVYVESGEASNVVEKGRIIRQRPAGGVTVPTGSEVIVFVSTGPEKDGLIEIPNVVGMTEDAARQKIDEAKLISKITYISTSSQKSGVVEQRPEAGKKVSELTEIDLTINKYEENPTTPTPTPTPTSITEGKREVTIDLNYKAERDSFVLKVVSESVTSGRVIEYEARHNRSEGMIKVYVVDIPGAMIKVYHDDKLVSEYILQ